MGVRTRSKSSAEREKWDTIFNALVEMVRTRQHQLEALVEERKILDDRIKMQHERWVSDVRYYEDCISQLKTELETKEKVFSLEVAKADMLIGWKRREASISKLKLDEIESELSDFRCMFNILTGRKNISQKGVSEVSKDISGSNHSNLNTFNSKTLESEIRRLKLQSEAIALEKNSQVAAISAENEFIWNQFNILQNDLTDKLKGKDVQLQEAHKNIETLIANTEKLNSSAFEKDKMIERLKAELSQKETDIKSFDDELSRTLKELDLLRNTGNSLKGKDAQLQETHKNIETLIANTEKLNSSAFEKDKMIERLKAELSQKETDIKRFDGELSRTLKELDLLRNTGNSSVTPLIRHCPSKERSSFLALKNGGLNSGNVIVAKELTSGQATDSLQASKGSRRSKRKEDNTIPISQTPKLFSSSFKVPKLKSR